MKRLSRQEIRSMKTVFLSRQFFGIRTYLFAESFSQSIHTIFACEVWICSLEL